MGNGLSNISEYTVKLSGSLTVATIAEAYQSLVTGLDRGEPVVVDLDAVVEADLTLAQLLESARRTAAERGQALRLEKPAEGAVLQVLERGGFLDPGDADRVHFWCGEQ
ncbi:STAS domain-containing protein [Caulobacter segnis]|uniref:Anti-anti-sigma factor n=1 Tax=Caulobacter segnis TaxID=88688 RepID=A0A2W5VC74_9CAUL|nr:MAG: anti-anti-sigma factor [Caulobacter segnis]